MGKGWTLELAAAKELSYGWEPDAVGRRMGGGEDVEKAPQHPVGGTPGLRLSNQGSSCQLSRA